jgi:hypothetical protein
MNRWQKSRKASNFSLHWTGSSRLRLFQFGRVWRLLPASELPLAGKCAMRLRVLICLLGAVVIVSVAADYWPFVEDSSDPWPRSHGLIVDFVGYSGTNAIIQVKNPSSGKVQLESWVQIDYADAHAEAHRFTTTNLPSRGTLAMWFPAPTNHVAWKAAIFGYRPRERGLKQYLNSTAVFRRHPLDLSYRYGWTRWQNAR